MPTDAAAMTEKTAPIVGEPLAAPRKLRHLSGPCVVITDTHGQLRKLKDLWATLHEQVGDFEERSVVFLGDYVDKGPSVRQSLEWLVHLKQTRPKTYFLMGNHDLVFAEYLDLLPKAQGGEWLTKKATKWANGREAEPTFRSYESGKTRAGLKRAVPPPHQQFISELDWVITHDEFVFVHAGLCPTRSLQTQIQELVRRDTSIQKVPALHSKTFLLGHPQTKKCIVSGHVKVDDLPSITPHRILLDTSGGYSGPLSAVLLPERTFFQSNTTLDHTVTTHPNSELVCNLCQVLLDSPEKLVRHFDTSMHKNKLKASASKQMPHTHDTHDTHDTTTTTATTTPTSHTTATSASSPASSTLPSPALPSPPSSVRLKKPTPLSPAIASILRRQAQQTRIK